MPVVLILSLLALGALAICLLCLGHMLCLVRHRLLDVEQALAREHVHLASGADRCFTKIPFWKPLRLGSGGKKDWPEGPTDFCLGM